MYQVCRLLPASYTCCASVSTDALYASERFSHLVRCIKLCIKRCRLLPASYACFFLPLTHAAIGQVVEAANGFFVADAKEAARCVKTMLKCSGCGALCDDTAQFQVSTSI